MAYQSRKPGPIPKFARNQTDLGAYLMPPRDRKIIQRAMKREGCPGRTADGRYDIALWQVFITANFASDAPTEDQTDKRKLEEEKLRLTNEKLRFQISVMQREYSANTDIEQWVGSMVMNAKRVLLAIPGKLAPVIVGMTEVEAEIILKTEINAALAQLAASPLHGDKAPIPAAPEPAAAPTPDAHDEHGPETPPESAPA